MIGPRTTDYRVKISVLCMLESTHPSPNAQMEWFANALNFLYSDSRIMDSWFAESPNAYLNFFIIWKSHFKISILVISFSNVIERIPGWCFGNGLGAFYFIFRVPNIYIMVLTKKVITWHPLMRFDSRFSFISSTWLTNTLKNYLYRILYSIRKLTIRRTILRYDGHRVERIAHMATRISNNKRVSVWTWVADSILFNLPVFPQISLAPTIRCCLDQAKNVVAIGSNEEFSQNWWSLGCGY